MSPRRSARLTAIDALRGVAAVFVIFPHFVGFFAGLAAGGHLLGRAMMALGAYGHAGVDVFFVISGFVIAFTTRDHPVTRRNLPEFLVRRLSRLAPPYWVSIGVMLAVLYLQAVLTHRAAPASVNLATPAATAKLVAAHLLYLQDVLGLGNINAVYWTLCIEVQFYFVFASGSALFAPGNDGRAKARVGTALLVLSWLASVLLAGGGDRQILGWTFMPCWHEFALGILACRFVGGRGPAARSNATVWFLAVAGLILSIFQQWLGLAAAVATCGIICFLGRRGRLGTSLDWPPLQFLGKISYSLYLTHVPVGFVLLGIKSRLVREGVVGDSAMFLLAVVCSLCLAEIFRRLVERPAIGWSRSFQFT